MLKHWWGVALLAAWLGQASAARAQYLPSELGATRMFDPEPVKPTKPLPNNLVPGPLTPDIAPPGPPDELALPESLPNAFPAELYGDGKQDVVFSIGSLGLQRSRLPHSMIAIVDPVPRLVPAIVNIPVSATVTTPPPG